MARHAEETRGDATEERATESGERDELASEVRHPAQVIVRVALAVLIAAVLILTFWALIARSA